jgi:hypothetical protein
MKVPTMHQSQMSTLTTPPATAPKHTSPSSMVPVRVSYAVLQQGAADSSLATLLTLAYGPDGLGLILVDGIPSLHDRRAALLPLASNLATLDETARAQLEDPQSSYNVGWSHGKETLANGVPGTSPALFSPRPTDAYQMLYGALLRTLTLLRRMLTGRVLVCGLLLQTCSRRRSTPTPC